MQDLTGKKLLILGGSSHEADLVRKAQSLGVHTIVTDYYDPQRSPAKLIADEYWNISWSDQDALEQKCREEGIDGVAAGYSEFTVENQIKLCQRLGLPCYITMEQLEITRDKIKFKNACRKNGVPVVKEYATVEEVDEFPVIVKPVDRAGSIGISVATDRESLLKAYDYAMEMSVCKSVIIEKYIENQTKFDVCYVIYDGQISILSSSDTINAANNGMEKVVQSGWMYPSINQTKFEKTTDRYLRAMIADMGIKHGYIFFSGFSNGTDFVFFECGFRLSGGHIYTFTETAGTDSVEELFIYHALTGETKGFQFENYTRPDLKAVVLNMYAKAGTLARMDGIEQIKAMDTCGYAAYMSPIGQECREDTAILTKLAMFHFYDEDPNVLSGEAKKAYSYFVAEDTAGNDMVFDRMDTDMIKSWWN